MDNNIMLASTARQFNKVLSKIIEEHYFLTKGSDSNLNYLWWMYYKGNQQSTFKPFMILAEINLCFEMGIVTTEEKENMINMLSANDPDSLFIVFSSLKFFRQERIKKFKEFSDTEEEITNTYKEIKENYAYKVLNIDLMNRMMVITNTK